MQRHITLQNHRGDTQGRMRYAGQNVGKISPSSWLLQGKGITYRISADKLEMFIRILQVVSFHYSFLYFHSISLNVSSFVLPYSLHSSINKPLFYQKISINLRFVTQAISKVSITAQDGRGIRNNFMAELIFRIVNLTAKTRATELGDPLQLKTKAGKRQEFSVLVIILTFKEETYLLYIRTQCVPHSKHSPLRL
jgi:hypothetical protein